MSLPMGICRACGNLTTLTYEHLPPRRAFNRSSRALRTIEGFLRGHQGKRTFRRGLGHHAFCGKCNELTAKWYGDAFADWTIQCLNYASRIDSSPSIYVPLDIKPLNVIKQIATIAVAMAAPASLDLPHVVELRRFVLDPTRKHLPAPFSALVYLNAQGRPVFSGSAVVLTVSTGRHSHVWSEVSVPPLGYCMMTDRDSTPSHSAVERLCDVSVFGECEFEERKLVWLRLANLRPGGTYPLHYN
jgi:hypothetical protein